MVSKLGFAGGLQFESSFVYLKVYSGLHLVCLTFPSADMGPHVREGIKKHDTHIEPKSYKLELLGKLVV